MLRRRHQYRILQTAFVFALIAVAFFAAYQGARHWDAAEAHGFSILIGKKDHPRPFSLEWFMGDPVAFASFALALFTALLFTATVWMARGAERSSDAALKASTRALETLIATERPYVTGGGGFTMSGPRTWVFLVDVANNGKTPALLTHYDVQFETFKNVQTGPMKITKKYKHFDWLGPGEKKKGINAIAIPNDKNVVFGGFWYSDFQKKEHRFRFILSIDPDTTRPNIADLVDASYTHWD